MRVLLATRGSEHSADAVKFLRELMQVVDIQLTVLTVLKRRENAAAADVVFHDVARLLNTAVTGMKLRLRRGDVASEIVEEVQEGHHDLLVMGERETHSLATRILGSVTRHVLLHIPCPVVIAKGEVTPLQRILLCDAGFLKPTLLERLADQLPDLLHADAFVTVLHVMSQISAGPGVEGKQLRAEADELIEAHAPEGEVLERDLRFLARQSDFHPYPKVRHGFVVDEIVDEANSGDYDLVVIGAHQYGRWDKLLLDNLARQIVEQSPRPVLLVP